MVNDAPRTPPDYDGMLPGLSPAEGARLLIDDFVWDVQRGVRLVLDSAGRVPVETHEEQPVRRRVASHQCGVAPIGVERCLVHIESFPVPRHGCRIGPAGRPGRDCSHITRSSPSDRVRHRLTRA